MASSINRFTAAIDRFTAAIDQKINQINFDSLPQVPDKYDARLLINELVNEPIHLQNDLFKADWKYHFSDFSKQVKCDVLWEIRSISLMVAPVFLLIADIFRCCYLKSISLKSLALSVCHIPLHFIKGALSGTIPLFLIADKIVSGVSIGTGNLIWHGCESIAIKLRRTKKENLTEAVNKSILSDSRTIRTIVYQSIGITALSAAALCIPVLSIQMVALTVLAGSICATLNNLKTNRDCPEYYTMGHYYDGKNVRGHAIKSMNPNLKALITGCYASTTVTRIAGYILSAAATLPFTAATVPLAISVAIVATSVILGIAVAHILSRKARLSEEKHKDDVIKLAEQLGVLESELDVDNSTPKNIQQRLIVKYDELQKMEKSDEIKELANRVLFSKKNYYDEVPMSYQAGWHANNTRNTAGYAVSGIGSLIGVITIISLRIFVY